MKLSRQLQKSIFYNYSYILRILLSSKQFLINHHNFLFYKSFFSGKKNSEIFERNYDRRLFLIIVAFILSLASVMQAAPLVSAGSIWKYDDTGTDLHSQGWPSIDDTGWSSGPAPLGYTDTHIVTTIYNGGSSRYPCY